MEGEQKVNSDFIIAVTIFVLFAAFIVGIFADGFIREWIEQERMRKSYMRKV